MGGKKGGGATKAKPTTAPIAQEELAWKGCYD